jgi:hypothetical protein
MKKILALIEYPTISDTKRDTPFTSGTFHDLRLWMEQAGFNTDEVEFHYLYPTFPPANKPENFYCTKTQYIKKGYKPWGGKFISPSLALAFSTFLNGIKDNPPELILAFGELSLLCLTNEASITNWRGSQLFNHNTRIVPLISPVKAQQNFEWTFLVRYDLKRAFRFWGEKQVEPEWKFQINPKFYDALKFLRAIPNGAEIGVDIETRLKYITYISVAVNPTTAISIPFVTPDGAGSYWKNMEEFEIVKELLRTMHRCVCVGQNFVYDLQYLARYWGARPTGWKDTMLMWHVRHPGLRKSIDMICSLTLPWYAFWKEEGVNHSPNPEEVNQYQIYNCKDAANTLHAYQLMQSEFPDWVHPLIQEQHDTAYAMLKMMYRGVRQDLKVKREQIAKCMNLRMEVEAKLMAYTPCLTGDHKLVKGKTKTPWYGSSSQTMKILYEIFRLPVQKKRQTGQPTVDDKALTELEKIEPLFKPIFQLIKEYRSLGVFISTFLEVELDWDNRMRCSYGVGMAETFRCTSSTDAFGFGGNLQNIPSGNED